MQQFTEVQPLQTFLNKQKGKKIGFVPTMGALHEGHLSLVKLSQETCDLTVVSIFINPTQFGKKEDLSSYPNPINEDLNTLKEMNVDGVFTPNKDTIYLNQDHPTEISAPYFDKLYCGVSRPHFFKGVCSVVLRLFHIIKPHEAFFGEKDFQQLFIIKKMVNDLFLPIKITSGPIIREDNGLAMSSRNVYLSKEDIQSAKEIYACLKTIKSQFPNSIKCYNEILEIYNNHIDKIKKLKVDYIDVIDPNTLLCSKKPKQNDRIITATYCNNTRLIDNISL